MRIEVIGGILGLISWWLISYFVSRGEILPSPSVVAEALVSECMEGRAFSALMSTLSHYLPGVLLGASIGIGFASLFQAFPTLRRFFSVILRVLRPIPTLGWLPLAIAWFGITHLCAAVIIGIGVFWILFEIAESSFSSVDKRFFELAQLVGRTSKFDQWYNILVPASLPAILGGMRTGFGQGWIYVVGSELGGVAGLGQQMWESSGLLATDRVVAYLIIMALCYCITDVSMSRLSRGVLVWIR